MAGAYQSVLYVNVTTDVPMSMLSVLAELLV